MGKNPTKRQKIAYSKRIAVMSSTDFGVWWSARRHIHPVPSDPFRAYMIDRGIRAKLYPEPIWKPRTNRADLPPNVDVDLSRRGQRLPKKWKYSKHEFREDYTPKSAKPIGKLTPQEQKLKAHVAKMAEYYHTSVPDVVFERGVGEGISAMVHSDVGLVRPFMRIGIGKKASLPKLLAVVSHEMGHHVHKRGQVGQMKALGINQYDVFGNKIEKEKAAWKIADPFMSEGRVVQKWTEKYYLGTYLGTSPRRG